jgi:hypothetical protein
MYLIGFTTRDIQENQLELIHYAQSQGNNVNRR